MNINEWWQNHTTLELKKSLKSHYDIDLDFIKSKMNKYYYDMLDENSDLILTSFPYIPNTKKQLTFILSVHSKNGPLLIHIFEERVKHDF